MVETNLQGIEINNDGTKLFLTDEYSSGWCSKVVLLMNIILELHMIYQFF